mmetsp:Transcript_84515/g.182165  ORF Transcript_84515/g.182165 Transcript_84515/m.182165 type:complete len:90 (+) Transcript_84515:2103-2372(+)
MVAGSLQHRYLHLRATHGAESRVSSRGASVGAFTPVIDRSQSSTGAGQGGIYQLGRACCSLCGLTAKGRRLAQGEAGRLITLNSDALRC